VALRVGKLGASAHSCLRLSQTALAYRAGTTQQAISRIEHGLVSPTVEMLSRLAAACGDGLALGWKFAGEIAGKALAALSDG
jgi:transcriptional regulator with XRE-family HTH domain